MVFLWYVCKIVFTSSNLLSWTTLTNILDYFTIAIAVIIVAVPEGLPLSISIAMAFSVDTLKKEELLIKKLEGAENMGSITEICTGKTATITQNVMNVTAFYTGERFY